MKDIMQKALSLFRPLLRSENRETEPILDSRGHESPPPYISINSSDASVSCNSVEETATVTCSTCRGTGRIPRGIAWGRIHVYHLAPYTSLSILWICLLINAIGKYHSILYIMLISTSSLILGQEKELVALIPYSDQRLKPRRT